jgi:hypothetical protein
VQRIETIEREVAAVHDIERARLGDEHIENIHVVELAVGDVDETGDTAA